MSVIIQPETGHGAPRRLRLRRALQCLSCVLVAWAALRATQQDVLPVLATGSMMFAPPARPPASGLAALSLAPGLSTVEVIVQHNDTLDRIFRRLSLSLGDLANLRALDGVRAMLDRLNPGEQLRFFHRDGMLMGLERHLSLTQKLEVTRADDGFHADVVAKPIETRTQVAHGVIDSSLFEAGDDAGLSDPSILKLAKIFGWDIDFVLDLRDGDEFTVDYERIYQDGRYVKDGEILAASFINQGRDYRAVRYVAADGSASYYSPDGRSMEKAFLRAPLEFRRISSSFSTARLHPILNRIRAHKGVDYAAPTGTPVYAAGAGRLLFRGPKGGYGNVIEIDHGGGIVTVYGHLSRFAAPRTGTRVQQGETIGYVGMTGLATGPHLHYEYHVNGVYVDPQKVRLPDATPIDAALRADFLRQTAPLLAALDPPAAHASTVAAR
jgi:murein DD-endopeptidase MepM/ murein hydrolase activator NlpD